MKWRNYTQGHGHKKYIMPYKVKNRIPNECRVDVNKHHSREDIRDNDWGA